MTPGDAASLSLSNLARRKGRTLLTLVGVVIGVTALVLMVSLALGLKREVLKLFEGDDALRTIFISRQPAGTRKSKGFNLFDFGSMAVPINDKDLKELRSLPGIQTIIPNLNLLLNAKIQESETEPLEFIAVGGVAPEEGERYRRMLIAGAFWADPAERAVLVPSRLIRFRTGQNPESLVGKTLVFSRAYSSEEDDAPDPAVLSYRIAGVLDSEKLGFKAGQLYLPMEHALELRELTRGGNVPILVYKKGSYLSAEIIARDLAAVKDLQKQLANSGYQALTSTDILGAIGTVFFVIEGFMACIGAIGLLVSVFGIANTMAMAVLERTREIGILKAVGARNSDIRRIFLMEAAAIGLLGGAIGLGAGVGLGSIANLAAHGMTEIPKEIRLFHVSGWLAAGSLVFAVAVSIMAGWVPAYRAARLDPVRALRYE